jgi:hypothetical protein
MISPPIRARKGPGLPFRRVYFRNMCKKQYTFTHFFQKTVLLTIYAKRSVFHRTIKRYCTLLGGKTQGVWIGSTVKGKRTPFLGPGTKSPYVGHRRGFHASFQTPSSCKISRRITSFRERSCETVLSRGRENFSSNSG